MRPHLQLRFTALRKAQHAVAERQVARPPDRVIREERRLGLAAWSHELFHVPDFDSPVQRASDDFVPTRVGPVDAVDFRIMHFRLRERYGSFLGEYCHFQRCRDRLER